MDEAIDRGWITPFAPGQYLYGPVWTRLVRTLQTTIVGSALDLGFEEWTFPRMLPSEALDSFELTQYNHELLVPAGGAGTRYLDPVQCISLYHAMRGRSLRPADLPLLVVETLGGWTWRNEDDQRLDGPYRAVEFNRVEHVYLGTPDQVREVRERVRSGLCELLSGLGLSWQVVVGAPCMDLPSIEGLLRAATHAEEVPVQDIEVPIRRALRHDQRRAADFDQQQHAVWTEAGALRNAPNDAFYLDTDELAGCSVEGSHLPDQFGLTIEGGGPLWSGCCGIGLNRLVVALLYQHGFDPAAWPAPLRS